MSLTQRLIAQAEHWEGKRYGDQTLRLRAEATSAILREAANEFQQLREWIEQLKTTRNPTLMIYDYNRAIDDVLAILNSPQVSTGDDASRETAKRMAVRGPSPTSQQEK